MESSPRSDDRAIVEVLEIRNEPPVRPGLAGYCVDVPCPGATSQTYALRIAGWVVGQPEPVTEIEIGFEGRPLRRTPVALARPDVAEVHSRIPHAGASGFDTEVGLIGLPRDARIDVDAVLPGDRRTRLARIAVRRRPLASAFRPALQPLMVTSLFRMGTTRLMRLLAEHPAVVVQKVYPYETRVASYWMHAMKVLAEPANLHESSEPTELLGVTAWIGHNPFYRRPITDHPHVESWLGREVVERLTAFCQNAGEEFYRRVAETQGQTDAAYFGEKHVPDSYAADLLYELYPGAREIFLVRDFRDVVCSILSFNDKRGYASFGSQKADHDEGMIELLGERARSLSEAWRKRSDRALLVRYEELVTATERTLRSMFGHLAVDASEATIAEVRQRADRDTPELEFHRTSRSPAHSIGRWKRDLPAELIEPCDRHLGRALEEFGYEPTLVGSVSP